MSFIFYGVRVAVLVGVNRHVIKSRFFKHHMIQRKLYSLSDKVKYFIVLNRRYVIKIEYFAY